MIQLSMQLSLRVVACIEALFRQHFSPTMDLLTYSNITNFSTACKRKFGGNFPTKLGLLDICLSTLYIVRVIL